MICFEVQTRATAASFLQARLSQDGTSTARALGVTVDIIREDRWQPR